MRGSDLIIHCGDVGDPGVLEMLRTVAPVRAIRGNNDRGGWANRLPPRDLVEISGHAILVLHNLAELDRDTDAAGLTALVFGHSHKPLVEKRGGVLFINPGSAGPRRFKLPITVATLALGSGHRFEAKIVRLSISK
jgi:putative phosphoesterase